MDRISLAEAETLVTSAFKAAGVAHDAAASVGRALVAAEAEGQVGHGFSRIDDYIAQVRSRKINPKAKVSVSHPNPTAIAVDADYGFAYPALDAAIDAAIPIAKELGIATMAIQNSHHCGALSVQVDRLAREGLIALMFANTPKAMAPWGARDPFFGTNPIAFASPRQGGDPLVIDMSLSKVARGKIMHAKKSGQPIPEGWAIDAEGNPTTDPEVALGGSMLPIGDAKGSALALIVEIMASALTGGTPSQTASSFLSADGPAPAVGQFIIAIKPDDYRKGFAERIEALLTAIAAMDGTRLPGTRRLKAIQDVNENGLKVSAEYLEKVRALAGVTG